jgi:uncharacterized membrane protein
MTHDVVRRLIIVHGIVAWIDALLLLVVAILMLRKRPTDKPWFLRLSVIATLGAVAAFASGLLLEMHYRLHMRQRLFLSSKTLGWLFERKLHLSFGVLLFAVMAVFTLLLVRENPRALRAARMAFVIAASFAIITCVISSTVGMSKPFVE